MLSYPAHGLSRSCHEQGQQAHKVTHIHLLFIHNCYGGPQGGIPVVLAVSRGFQYSDEPAPANGYPFSLAVPCVDVRTAGFILTRGMNRFIGGV
jgi:hypothetical protein